MIFLIYMQLNILFKSKNKVIYPKKIFALFLYHIFLFHFCYLFFQFISITHFISHVIYIYMQFNIFFKSNYIPSESTHLSFTS